MKQLIFILFICYSCTTSEADGGLHSKQKEKLKQVELRDGDIVFQSTHSEQCEAVKVATHSKYSHCGIVFNEKGNYYVLEAVQPVKKTILNEWIRQGDGHYVAKRLKNSEKIISPDVIKDMHAQEDLMLGKNYDIYFGWSDEKIYCSELVWKIYKSTTGLEVGKMKKLKDFDLSSDIVKQIMAERYGSGIPYDENVVSPQDIFESDLLQTVIEK